MRKILVIDDDFAEIIKGILDDIGLSRKNRYEVDVSWNGTDALELARKNEYFFILLDGHLGDISGPEIVSGIREFNTIVPIIMVSGDEKMNELGMEMGANGVIRKITFVQDVDSGGVLFKALLKKIGVRLEK